MPSNFLFNEHVDIKRAPSTESAYYDRDEKLTRIGANVPCRITTNRWFGVAEVKDQGFQSVSTHRIFFKVGVDIKDGDYIQHGIVAYRVNLADPIPGGKTDSHIEAWVSKIEEN